MVIFLSIVGTLLFVIVGFTFLLTTYNTKAILDSQAETGKMILMMERMSLEQVGIQTNFISLIQGFNQLSGSLSMFADELGYSGPITMIQTPLGTVPARNLNEAIDKLQAKGISLTDTDIEELKNLFEADKDE